MLTNVCKSCGTRIYWARTRSGKAAPIDVTRAGEQDPPRIGSVRLRRQPEDPSRLDAEVVPASERSERLWTNHFETCPHAAAYRRRQ